MPRVRSPARDKAKQMYLDANGDIVLKDIASELGVSDTQIRKWKNQDKWEDVLNGNVTNDKVTSKSNVTKKTKTKSNGNKKSKPVELKPIPEDVKEVLQNEELTERQRIFCVAYVQCFNATKAYLKAYTCTYESAMVNGSRLLRNDKVREQIQFLKQGQLSESLLDKNVILQKYIDIALSDMKEYIKFGKKYKKIWGKDENGNDVPVIDPETGEQKEIEYNYIDLNESTMVDTTLISEVSQGKDGIKFKLLDKMRAMEFLMKHYNVLDDDTKNKLAIEKMKLENEKLKAETNRIIGDDGPEIEDDGFLEALNGKAAEVWKDE
ncbi:terminase small subunit [Clostridium sp. HBUAS56017]|uniref:terminase small subunit n=1 Tax=Clostridium sp. HBUAS56017 TaxID=2571128 RepID=UPI0011774BEE|nr:terminase small subunit [Clostridium sp. HBUAS56017]